MPTITHTTLDDWIAREAIAFSVESPASVNAVVDKMIALLGDSVELLGFGEALHGGEEILILRNRIFERLVEAHGYSAIAVESSFSRAHVVNEYVAGRGAVSYEALQESGFSHGFGRLEANRELVEWMRRYNADPSHHVKLHFYGFDSPTEMMGTDSPRQLLHFALDYLTSIDGPTGERRKRIDLLLGEDSAWENPAAMMNPSESIGLSPDATALRIETEDLITELHLRRPELTARSDRAGYLEATQHALVARHLLNYHATLARTSSRRTAELLGIRDLIMAENLKYAIARERGQEQKGGKVLAFAHNTHLQRGQAQWQLGPDLCQWWTAGSHLTETLGPRYAVIGSAVGISDANGIAAPEPRTLEARLIASAGPACFIPTHRGQSLPAATRADVPIRSGSNTNSSYFPLSARSFTDFDWLAVLDSATYNRNISLER